MILLVLGFLLNHDAKGTRVNLCYLLLRVVFPCGTGGARLLFDHIYLVCQMVCLVYGGFLGVNFQLKKISSIMSFERRSKALM